MTCREGPQGLFADEALIDDGAVFGFDDRDAIGISLEKSEVEVDVDESHLVLSKDAVGPRDSLVTQRATPPGIDDHTHPASVPTPRRSQPAHTSYVLRHTYYVLHVRPVTSIAIAVVLALIVIAFVIKLLTGGLTP